MQQTEILSLVERLIPVYRSGDLDYLLSQMTEGHPPSAKLLVKMELNRLMAPCTKSIDLRGKVQGECREYHFDGRQHWLDDVAFNSYQKSLKKFGAYTEGVWEAVNNTRNNFRVMKQQGKLDPKTDQPKDTSFEVELSQAWIRPQTPRKPLKNLQPDRNPSEERAISTRSEC